MTSDQDNDLAAIRHLIARQFSSMSWRAGGRPDWKTFGDDFLAGAQLFPSARPAQARSIGQFIERMDGLVGSALKSLEEEVVGTKITTFGNVAVAVVTCQNTENAVDVGRNVEMMLLVKTQGRWRIAAQAWDKETERTQVPRSFLVQD